MCLSCRAFFYLRTAVFVQREKGQFCSAWDNFNDLHEERVVLDC